MRRPALEIADIFRDHGPAWRAANAGHVSLDQLRVMSAIEACRTARLGGTVVRCDACQYTQIQYCSCRNRHCPKCQSAAARQWLADREAELLPISYHHVVFTLPAAVARIAWHNKAVVYDLLFKASAETLLTIAADPRHLGARIGLTTVLHTWGSAMTHTHRVAISNRRLIRADADSVTVKVKDYRVEGPSRYTTTTLATDEFIRRFLMHVLPKGLHRIRHYGLLANGNRVANLARMRELLGVAISEPDPQGAGEATATEPYLPPCPCCGRRMRITLIAQAGFMPCTDAAPPAVIRIDTS